MLPNKDIDPTQPKNTRELREQIDRAKRLAAATAQTSGAGYVIVNTAPAGQGVIPEPTVMNISRDPGAPLRLPFDEKTPPQVDVPNWSTPASQQRGPADAQLGESNIQWEADAFYGLTPSKSAED